MFLSSRNLWLFGLWPLLHLQWRETQSQVPVNVLGILPLSECFRYISLQHYTFDCFRLETAQALVRRIWDGHLILSTWHNPSVKYQWIFVGCRVITMLVLFTRLTLRRCYAGASFQPFPQWLEVPQHGTMLQGKLKLNFFTEGEAWWWTKASFPAQMRNESQWYDAHQCVHDRYVFYSTESLFCCVESLMTNPSLPFSIEATSRVSFGGPQAEAAQ